MTIVVQERPVLEVADVLRAHGAAYLAAQGPHLSRDQVRAVKELALCRTAALGGHTEQCAGCGSQRISYNSCRNRHCPKCQASTRAVWLEREAQTLLPVDYYHVVFTLPAALGPLALQNQRLLYDLLVRTAWETVRELASDPHYLGATVGLLAVLHTWGQNLCHHPHVHCVVTGGGRACDVNGRAEEPPRWLSCRPGFFLPVRVLSRLFRGKYLAGLRAAYDRGALGCHGQLAPLAEPAAFAAWLAPLYAQDWVVYAKAPFGGPEQVLKYLARYTHRVAISNSRLVKLEDSSVTFRYKDYADDRRHKTMVLPAHEFIRRFLQHVLPSGFVKIRHYGLLANRYREANLRVCRTLLLVVAVAALAAATTSAAAEPESACLHCGGLIWLVVARTDRPRVVEVCRLSLPVLHDSS
jgi:Putative transposase/Transposase zinc-binding domain